MHQRHHTRGVRRPYRQKRFTSPRPGRGKGLDVSLLVRKAVPLQEEDERYLPKHTFGDFDIAGELKEGISQKRYVSPTMIQDEAIPVILQGRDIVGIANTGTGKTAAFLIPLINKAVRDPSKKILVITPTRELASQIEEEFRSFARLLNLRSVLCIGGGGMQRQITSLGKRPHCVIGTPGRLKDLVQKNHLRLEGFSSVVLDEADRMLDMGFIDDVKFLLSRTSRDRQTLLFSATFPREIEQLAYSFLTEPVKVLVKEKDKPLQVDQDVIHARDTKEKIDTLCDLLTKPEFKKVLVFGRTKRGVERLSRELKKRGVNAVSIHGDKVQSKRQAALDQFRRGTRVLVATDVAARGLDIPDVTHVINFDIPATYEDYVHRIGRTGRANKKGTALTFI